ncbi:hypothetical protein A2Z33_03745 [Candidatus Gottesmanbacteria bacterium RBG_16_52_11]|uniref:Glycosyltransferase RgtA/B/C/D-like domain-containing protein n=1 Tax=Candidatus Gottesmanbacteria bacterium RBG_16_52_11 TaxID=1798374 RepID=A0A1F5YW90_9BACT|nr:MAG: hypothetical protein A2Z33_03745 [Candidatus Gottesmanbacteria bacterium RBG_16_52_11]
MLTALPRRQIGTLLLFTGFLVFSFWLMLHTLGYDPETHTIRIASTLWSDFGAHLPLVRSFSIGSNWWRITHWQAPQSPLFPGEKIRYHFLFYMIAGVLERAGLRFDWAVNIPSALGLSGLLVFLFLLIRRLFASTGVALLTVLFFLFNGSLAFLKFFRAHPLSPATPLEILSADRFPAFGPWDGGPVSAFWNFNIYTNQRHLALSFAVCLAVIYILLIHDPKQPLRIRFLSGLGVGVLAGSLFFLNQAALLIAVTYLFFLFFLHPPARFPVLSAFVVLVPAFLVYRNITADPAAIGIDPGYLIEKPLTAGKFLWYWWHNLGFHLILMPAGFLLASRRLKLLALPLLLLFALPNVFRLSPDMINNHKLFNFVVIMGSAYSALALYRLWRLGRGFGRLLPKTLTVILIFLVTVSGIIDISVIANDRIGGLYDYPVVPEAVYFLNHSAPDDLVLNSNWFYHPASLVGRDIYSGYAYFTWSYGYDKDAREEIMNAIYNAPDGNTACRILSGQSIDLVELSDKPEGFIKVNWSLWKGSFRPSYRNSDTGVSIYRVSDICPGL